MATPDEFTHASQIIGYLVPQHARFNNTWKPELYFVMECLDVL